MHATWGGVWVGCGVPRCASDAWWAGGCERVVHAEVEGVRGGGRWREGGNGCLCLVWCDVEGQVFGDAEGKFEPREASRSERTGKRYHIKPRGFSGVLGARCRIGSSQLRGPHRDVFVV